MRSNAESQGFLCSGGMDLEDLAVVAAVRRLGSVSAAADELHTSQPALSRRLARIERELGGALFDRGRHGARPTPAGRLVADGAEEVLASLGELRQRARDATAGRRGRLRIGTTPTLGADILPAVLSHHRARHPEVELEVESNGDSSVLVDDVLAGRLDLALAVVPRAPDRRLAVPVDGWQFFVLVVPDGHPLTARESVPIPLVLPERLVVMRKGAGLREVVDRMFDDLSDGRPDISIETTDREMLIPLVAAGLGVTLLPAVFARHRVQAGVTVCELHPRLRRRVGAIVRDGSRPALVQGFLDSLDEQWEREVPSR